MCFKTQGIVVSECENGFAKAYHLPDISAEILAEVERFVRLPLALVEVTAVEFQQQLANVYQTKSSVQMRQWI